MSIHFQMFRASDESGVSGVGHVLDGIEFDNGKVAVTWYGKGGVNASSVAVYDSYDDFLAIHVDSHPTNGTRIIKNQLTQGEVLAKLLEVEGRS